MDELFERYGRVFQWDRAKSDLCKRERGCSFKEATVLWGDPNGVILNAPDATEPRWALIALMNGKIWRAVCTDRGDIIRIISVYRASTNFKKIYEDCD